jgi:hypothetical protein
MLIMDEEQAVEKAKRHFRVSTRPVGADAYFVTHEYGHDTTWALIAHLTRRGKPVPLSMPYEWLVEEIA